MNKKQDDNIKHTSRRLSNIFVPKGLLPDLLLPTGYARIFVFQLPFNLNSKYISFTHPLTIRNNEHFPAYLFNSYKKVPFVPVWQMIKNEDLPQTTQL